MISWIQQTIAVTLLSIRTIPQRLSSSIVGMVGIAGVVIVLVAVLSIAEGFRTAMADAGSPDRVLVMRSGADSEMTSGLGGPETDIIKQAPGICQAGGRPVASAELFVIVDLNKRSTGTAANVPLRGVEPTVQQVRAGAADRRRPDVHVRHERGDRRPRGRRPVCRRGPRLGVQVRRDDAEDRRHLHEQRLGGRDRDLVRRSRASGRLPPRQLVPVRARPARLARVVRHVQELADEQPAARRAGPPRERVLRGAVER